MTDTSTAPARSLEAPDHLEQYGHRPAGRVAVVTGGARGIGAGIVARLAAEGARVVFTYASATEGSDALTATVGESGGEATGIQVDSADRALLRGALSGIAAREGRLDIVVANAGGGTLKPVLELSEDEVDQMIAVNIRGTLDTIRFTAPRLREGGRVITIGSVSSTHFPNDVTSLYGMTKGAIASLVRGMSRELGPRGITINNVQPGPVDTPANPASGPAADTLRSTISVGRFGTAGDIAALVSHLAGPEGAFINGASLDIDGGYSARRRPSRPPRQHDCHSRKA